MLSFGRIFMERLVRYLYALQWPVDSNNGIAEVGHLTMVELMADFNAATGTLPPVPWKKGWQLIDEEQGAALVHRTVHQHSLVMYYAVQILAKNDVIFKMPATVQSPVLVLMGAKGNVSEDFWEGQIFAIEQKSLHVATST